MSDVLQNNLIESLNKNKNNIAIEKGDQVVTYKMLDDDSNKIASVLIEEGLYQSFIGIFLEDRINIINTIIGILKAGCIFVILDPKDPSIRIREMITEINIEYIVSDVESSNNFNYCNCKVLLLDDIYGLVNYKQLTVEYHKEHKIYVYFTSGSTGKPKAIVGRNKSLTHFINWEKDTFNLEGNYKFSQFTAPSFDVFLRDIFVPLLSGGTIVIPEDTEIILDSELLIEWINKKDIHLIHCVPTLFRVINSQNLSKSQMSKLKYVLMAGEKVNPLELKNWYEKMNDRIQLVNLYGPTETTLAKLYYMISKSDVKREVMPVGKPIKGTRVIILNENMEICDPLVTGEIYIRTPFRTFGYYNNAKLNEEKFIKNPFNNDKNDIIYKTGDLGRLLLDGNIELVGRVDRQVKIKGVRIELEGIENIAYKNPLVKEAAIIKYELSKVNSDMLVAFIVTKQVQLNETIIEELSAFFKQNIPQYMVPVDIIVVKSLPRLTSGKVDYKTLINIYNEMHKDKILPRDEVEIKLNDMWISVLGKYELGINNSFFKAGGNSLSLMKLISLIFKEFKVKVPLTILFENNTIEKQAMIIKSLSKLKEVNVVKLVDKREYYPISYAQQRLFILDSINKNSTLYNMTKLLLIEGVLEIDKLEKAFKKLIERHESLRTAFLEVDNKLMQKIYDNVDFKILIKDCGDMTIKEAVDSQVKSFDLNKAPLFRVALVKLEQNKNLLIVDMHHSISDGMSLNIIVKDIMAIYTGSKLPELKAQYKDYSVWENSSEFLQLLEKQKLFWISKLGGNIKELKLPFDYPISDGNIEENNFISFQLAKENVDFLNATVAKYETTLFVSLLTIFNIFLSKITGQHDIVIGTPVSRRADEIYENVVGMFVNTVVMRNKLEDEESFTELLKRVRDNTIEVLENSDYPFDELVKNICNNRNIEKNPLFNCLFELHDFEMKNIDVDGLSISPMEEDLTSKFDLTFSAIKLDEDITIIINFNGELFKRETVSRWEQYIKKIVDKVVLDTNIKIVDIQCLDEKEIDNTKNDKTIAIEFDF